MTHPGFPLRDRLLSKVLLIAMALLGVVSVGFRIVTVFERPVMFDDFSQDYLSARAWAADDNAYAPMSTLALRHASETGTTFALDAHRNPHTQAQIVMGRAMSWMPYHVARLVWLLLMVAGTVAGLYLIARELSLGKGVALCVAIGALALPIVQNDILYGQVSGLFVLVLALCWRWLRVGKGVRAGVALGVLTALKLFPGFLVIPLLRQRLWRAAVTQVVVSVAVLAISIVLMGSSGSVGKMTDAASANFEYWRGSPVSISLPATAFRWLTSGPWSNRTGNHEALAILIAVALSTACAVAAFRTPARLSGDVFLAATPWMILASPIAGALTLNLLLPLVFVIVLRSYLEGRRISLAAQIALALIVIGTPPGVPAARPDLGVLVIVFGYGVTTLALLAIGVLEWQGVDQPAPPAEGAPRKMTKGKSANASETSRIRSLG